LSSELVISILRGVPLFGSLGPVLLARLAEKSVSLKFNRGQTVLSEGQHCNNLFVIVSGRMEIFKGIDENTEIILQSLGRGETFGETHVLEGSPVTYGLRAVENCIVICVDRLTLNSLARDNSDFSRNYIRILNVRAKEALIREDILLKALLKSGLDLPEIYSVSNPNKKVEVTPDPATSEMGSVNASEDIEESNEADGVFFKKEYACPLCRNSFSTQKPRQKHVIAERSDEDFCMYYKTVNPLFYEINVCPRCGYSFNASAYGPVKVELKDGLLKTLADQWNSSNYGGTRSLDDAVETFKLAIECQKIRGADDSTLGKLFLKRAWLYRYKNLTDLEHRDLDKALDHLSKSFESASSDDPKEEMNLMFLLGQLHFILGDATGAVNWFVRITQHPQKGSYPYLVNRARDKWQEIRKK